MYIVQCFIFDIIKFSFVWVPSISGNEKADSKAYTKPPFLNLNLNHKNKLPNLIITPSED